MSNHGKISADKERLSVLIYKKDKKTLAGMAARDRRSLSSYCANLLEKIAGEQRSAPIPHAALAASAERAADEHAARRSKATPHRTST